MPFINAKNISLSYDGKKVIEDASFGIDSGDYLCIVGENGSGKTTLLKAILGLKSIDSGSIELCQGLKRSEIGYLPQQTEIQRDFPASVYEVVISGFVGSMGLRPFYTKKQKAMATEAMQKLEIENLSKKCYHELSGGQQQRVLLARAICASQRVLVLDEPTTGLDIGTATEFYKIISKLNSEGMTVIIISHDIENVVKYAGKVMHLDDHKPLFFGETKDYIQKFMSAGEGSK